MKRFDLPSTPRHILIYDEDWSFLQEKFGPNSASRYGTGPAIRDYIHKRVLELKAKEIELRDQRESAQ